MTVEELTRQLETFAPSGDEASDVNRLYEIAETIEAENVAQQLIPEMLRIFERNPNADLGSPGPLVHAIETCGMTAILDSLLSSIVRQPVVMTIWMAARCLRSPLDTRDRDRLIDALRYVVEHHATSDEVKTGAQEAIDEYVG